MSKEQIINKDWSVSFTLAEIRDAFIAGAREVKMNPTVSDHMIERASDGYAKLVQMNKQDLHQGNTVE